MTNHSALHARIRSGDRSAVWELFRAEIAEMDTAQLAAFTAEWEAEAEPGLDDAKLTELYAERDRRRAQGHEGAVR